MPWSGHCAIKSSAASDPFHQELQRRGVQIASRTVTDQLYRYEELLALSLSDPKRLQERLLKHGQVILALDGLQPDVGHARPLGFARLLFGRGAARA